MHPCIGSQDISTSMHTYLSRYPHANKYDPKYHLQRVFESDVIFLSLKSIYPCLPRTYFGSLWNASFLRLHVFWFNSLSDFLGQIWPSLWWSQCSGVSLLTPHLGKVSMRCPCGSRACVAHCSQEVFALSPVTYKLHLHGSPLTGLGWLLLVGTESCLSVVLWCNWASHFPV